MAVYKNTLRVNNLRGHTGYQTAENYDVDLRAILIKNEENKYYVIPGSSIRGIIRKNMKVLSCDTSPLGPEFGGQGKPSKIIVGWGYVVHKVGKVVRFGIKINKGLGTVEEGALYSYEIIPSKVNVVFEIRSIIELTQEEKVCLRRAIQLMKYSSIGWGGSKGIGIVEEVTLDDTLLN